MNVSHLPQAQNQPLRHESPLPESELEWLDFTPSDQILNRDQLAIVTADWAARVDLWQPRVRHDSEARWFERLFRNEALEVWLIGWTAGQWTSLHDHGGAAGALSVVEGILTELHFPDGVGGERQVRVHAAPATVAFEVDHIHRVGNRGSRNATSLHAYSPPGLSMRDYDETRLIRSFDGAAEWEATI